MVDTGLLSNGGSGFFIVAGEHHDVQLQRLQLLHSTCGVLLQGVRSCDSAQINALRSGKIQRCFSLGGKLRIFRHLHMLLCHQPAVSAEADLAIHLCPDPKARQRFKITGCRQRDPLGFCQDRLGEGMLGFLLQSRSDAQKLLTHHLSGKDVSHSGYTGGQRAGLIQHHRIHIMKMLQRRTVFEQYAHAGAPAGTHHDGYRGRKPQSAGAGYDQHGNGRRQGKFQIPRSDQPGDKYHRCDTHDHRHENARDLIRKSCNGCLGAAGFLHHTDHLGKCGILSHFIRTEYKITLGIDGGSRYGISGKLLHRNTFTCQSALIHRGSSFHHGAVHGDAPAGTDHDQISYPDLLRRDHALLSVTQDTGRFRAKIHQSPDGVAGLTLGTAFQKFTQSDQREDHGSGFKVQIFPVMLQGLPITMAHGIGHHEQGCDAVDQRRAGADRDKRIHIGAAVPQGLQPSGIIDPVEDHRRQGQHKLQQRRHQGVFSSVIPGRHREPHHMPHGKIHQNRQEGKAADDPHFHLLTFIC